MKVALRRSHLAQAEHSPEDYSRIVAVLRFDDRLLERDLRLGRPPGSKGCLPVVVPRLCIRGVKPRSALVIGHCPNNVSPAQQYGEIARATSCSLAALCSHTLGFGRPLFVGIKRRVELGLTIRDVACIDQ